MPRNNCHSIVICEKTISIMPFFMPDLLVVVAVIGSKELLIGCYFSQPSTLRRLNGPSKSMRLNVLHQNDLRAGGALDIPSDA